MNKATAQLIKEAETPPPKMWLNGKLVPVTQANEKAAKDEKVQEIDSKIDGKDGSTTVKQPKLGGKESIKRSRYERLVSGLSISLQCQVGTIAARTGLRMMPTFPRSPYHSVAVFFPHLVVGGLAGDMRSVMKRADRNMITDVVDALQPRARRRRWSDEVKRRIVAESCAPGAVVSDVARRHGISPQQLSAWRKALATAC